MTRKNRTGKVRRLVTVVFAILVAAVWLKLGSLLALSEAGQSAWKEQRFPDALNFASLSLIGNVVEAHKAHFNAGTASAAGGLYKESREYLRTALELSPPEDECVVRLNLGLVLEKLAENAPTGSERDGYTSEALAVIGEAPASCEEDALSGLQSRIKPGAGDAEGKSGEEKSDKDSGNTAPSSEESEDLGELRDQMTQGKADQGEEASKGKRKPKESVPKPW